MSSEIINKPSMPKLPVVRRRPLITTEEGLVKMEPALADKTLPLSIQPAVRGVDVISWARDNVEFIESLLHKHGALIFRNFDISSVEDFERFTDAVSGDKLMLYTERSSPRHEVKGFIYTSTDYPADQSIFPHNEHSYSLSWPMKLYLCCETPALQGGETPIGDCRRILQRIPTKTRERFAEKGWMYVRNFGDGFGLPWQTAFNTTDPDQVEAYCRSHDIQFQWKSAKRLRTTQVRPTLATHPRTGEEVWFNHATFFHITTLEKRLQQALRAGFKEEDLPNNTYYGDGTPIDDEVAESLRQAYLLEMVKLRWQKGDLLIVDNMLVSHSRSPYEGPRKILFAMAEPYTRMPASSEGPKE
jgi:alpha-ketoglutarate-dependent taurine dioxygenase